MKTIKELLSIFVILLVFISCQEKNSTILNTQTIITESDKIFEKLVKVRRAFHENPELAKEEKRTQETIKDYLIELGLEVKTDIYGNSVVGILKGDNSGRKIAWRADMDAIPNDFPDEVAFRSKVKGVQHGCGHDIHMAIGLGIAEVLSNFRSSIHGTIYFIFQPEEETFEGAKKMIENGLLSTIKPDEIFGLHVSALEVGKIMVKSKELFAYQKRVQITLKNEMSKSEAISLYKEIKNLMTRVQPASAPWDIQLMLDQKIGLSNPNTIFRDYRFMDDEAIIETEDDKLHIRSNLYETNQENLKYILPEIEKFIRAGKYKDLFYATSFIQENPTVVNDEQLTEESIALLSGIYGDELMLPDFGQIPYFNDDFCYFQQKIPGVYFLLGGSNFEKGMIAMNHAPNFMVDEECIRVGVRSFSSLIIERLHQKEKSTAK